MKRRGRDEKTAIDVVEEAVNLLRAAPLSALAAYYAGGIPFVLFLLHHAGRLASGIESGSGAVAGAFWLAVLFVWMKCWQTVFATELTACLRRAPAERWTPGRAGRMIVQQTALQPLGLLAIPLSALFTVPFAWVHAFFQNATVLGDGRDASVTGLIAAAWKQARPWPKQNHLGIWLLSPWMLGLGLLVFLILIALLGKLMPFTLLFVLVASALASAALAIGLLSPVGFLIAGNIAAMLVFIPWAAHHWFGWRTVFTLAGYHSILSTTFLFTVFAITYLMLDPVMKAFYVLRCFYGEARFSGEDLRVDLRTLAARAAAPLLVLLLPLAALLPSPARADDTTSPGSSLVPPPLASLSTPAKRVSGVPPAAAPAPDRAAASKEWKNDGPEVPTIGIAPAALDGKIDEVLQRPLYQWRLPQPEESRPEDERGWLARFFADVTAWIEKAVAALNKWLYDLERWLRRLFGRSPPDRDFAFGGPGPSFWMWLLVFGLIALALVAVAMLIRHRHRAPPADATAAAIPAIPDIHDENLLASQLPADEWLQLARELLAKGEFRAALRALFLASLAQLANRQLVTIARGKTNHDYLRELRRRAHALPAAPQLFGEGILAFERVWYGRDDASEALVLAAEQRLAALRDVTAAAPPASPPPHLPPPEPRHA